RSPSPASGRSQACADCVNLSALERWGGVRGGGLLSSPETPPIRRATFGAAPPSQPLSRGEGWSPRHLFGLISRFAPVALLACLIAIDAQAAPLPSQLGREVAITRPRDGYVGRLNVAPENGPAGTEVMVTADQLPPDQELTLVWRTVKG